MRNLSAVSALLVGFLGAAGAITVAACGNDSSGILADAGDASPDRFVKQPDAGMDGPRPDVTMNDTGTDTGVDTGTDTGVDTGVEAGHEAGVKDTGTDSGVESGTDSGHDAAKDARDAAHDTSDAGTDAPLPPTALTLPGLIRKQYCTQVSTCCVGSASATFNEAKCESDAVEGEYVPLTNLDLILNGLASTHYTFSLANAEACLSAIAGLTCASNTAAVLASVVTTCSSAYAPTLAGGVTGCQSSFDCETGYCAPFMPDSNGIALPPAGGGTCSALLADNSPCADTVLSSDCTHAPSSAPTAFCAGLDGGTSPVCQPSKAIGGNCIDTYEQQECLSGQCQPMGTTDYTCQAGGVFTVLYGSNLCAIYAQ
jgi:hypothetical protein